MKKLYHNKDQHIALASEETPGRSWGKRVLQLHTRKFGEGGFELADLEKEYCYE